LYKPEEVEGKGKYVGKSMMLDKLSFDGLRLKLYEWKDSKKMLSSLGTGEKLDRISKRKILDDPNIEQA